MISFQFATEAGFSSELIRAFDHDPFSHVDAILPTGDLLGARSDGGVLIRPAGYAKFTRTLRVDIPYEGYCCESFYDFLQGQVGKPYDMTAIEAFAVDRDWRDPKHWFCSELQAAALEQSGVICPLYNAVNKITPGDLLLVLSSLYEVPHG